jgi:hypothetical protein
MPDLILYLQAICTSAVVSTVFVSATFVLVVSWARRAPNFAWLNAICVGAMASGLACGYHILFYPLAWPPMNALDRFIAIVMPVALGIECFASFSAKRQWLVWCLRVCLAMAIPPIILWGSVYLTTNGEWTRWQAVVNLTTCTALLAGSWGMLSWLSNRSPGISVPLGLAQAALCAGMTVMMAGYINGGAAALPLVSVLLATSVAAWLISRRAEVPPNLMTPALLGVGSVGMFGLLFIGHFFGRLTALQATTIQLTPLLCWTTELPFLRKRRPSVVATIRLALVAIPLIIVLVGAKLKFDREMAPLLGNADGF